MTMIASTSLVYASSDRKHRPLSHPVVQRSPVADQDAYYAHIARRIRLLRSERGLSQRQLAARLGVTSVTICHWELGQTRPTAWNVDRLERTIGTVRP